MYQKIVPRLAVFHVKETDETLTNCVFENAFITVLYMIPKLKYTAAQVIWNDIINRVKNIILLK